MRIDRVKLVTVLKQRDMSQKALAEKAGISRVTVGYIASGKSCSDAVGHKIADALELSLSEIIEGVKT